MTTADSGALKERLALTMYAKDFDPAGFGPHCSHYHDLAAAVLPIIRAEVAKARAKKAEEERGDLRAQIEADSDVNYLLREDRDAWKAKAAHPRPLTPDDITDAMVERARFKGRELVGVIWDANVVRPMLAAALTEPPARPEGAEELAEVIDGLFTGDEGIYADDLADSLARLGVRVTGKDN